VKTIVSPLTILGIEATPDELQAASRVLPRALRIDAPNGITQIQMPDGTFVLTPLTIIAIVAGGIAKAKTIDKAIADAMQHAGIPKKERMKTFVELFFVFQPIEEVEMQGIQRRLTGGA
jgi:hypothetical protein|tara:strand:- start:223 stop:579 length:357 start_codon:yes stop_codon:yes gene_type:complete